MKTKVILVLSLLTIFLFNRCSDDEIPELKSFTEQAVNVEDVNTEYDEMNETVTGFLNQHMTFLISSNKNSNGSQYDIHNYLLRAEGLTTGNSIFFDLDTNGYEHYNPLISKINTTSNEGNVSVYRNTYYGYDIFLYTTDSSGHTDFHYSEGDIYTGEWEEPLLLNKLNTSYNEQEIAIINNTILYSSNLDGDYDIYKVDINEGSTLIDWVESTATPEIINYELLNSPSDDRCPHPSGSYIYFSSNRDGGYGGYDLYYSNYSNGAWSEPINCGENINSEFDELNPFTIYYGDYKNDLLFFSSNRTSGKGGFDIYAAGIPKLIY